MCAELAKAMQEAVDENQFFEIDALLEQYRNQDIKLLCKKYKIEAPPCAICAYEKRNSSVTGGIGTFGECMERDIGKSGRTALSGRRRELL